MGSVKYQSQEPLPPDLPDLIRRDIERAIEKGKLPACTVRLEYLPMDPGADRPANLIVVLLQALAGASLVHPDLPVYRRFKPVLAPGAKLPHNSPEADAVLRKLRGIVKRRQWSEAEAMAGSIACNYVEQVEVDQAAWQKENNRRRDHVVAKKAP